MGDLLEFDSRIKKKSKQHNLHSHQKFIIWQRFHSHPYTLTKWFFSLPIALFRPPGRRTRCVCALLSFDIHIFIVTAKWSSPLFGFWDSSHILGNYLLLLHRVAYVLLVSCWFFFFRCSLERDSRYRLVYLLTLVIEMVMRRDANRWNLIILCRDAQSIPVYYGFGWCGTAWLVHEQLLDLE